MELPTSPTSAAGRSPAPLRRSADDRMLTGVAAGLAERLGVPPTVVRAALVALAPAGGVGVLGYLGLLAASREAPVRPPGEPAARSAPVRSDQRIAAVGLITAGCLLVLRDLGLWFGDAVVWPVALAALGTAVLWVRGDEADRQRWSRLAGGVALRPARTSLGRVSAGLALVAGGLLAFVTLVDARTQLGTAALAATAGLAGTAIVLGPYVAQLAQQVRAERRERIRSEERAEMAAHLHDSVLHTLALIQKADAPSEVVGLARAQERRLRAWLSGADPHAADLRSALDELVGRIEAEQAVRVELVVVGDADLDEGLRALVAATGEAVTNAAKHAGTGAASVYVEVEPEAVTAYVRDEGAGFEPAAVPADRRGITESIVGRMARHGGTAAVTTAPGEGTEVVLRLERGR